MFLIKKNRHVFLATQLDVSVFLKGRKTTQHIVLFGKMSLTFGLVMQGMGNILSKPHPFYAVVAYMHSIVLKVKLTGLSYLL